ncbi:hypothetical protein ATANTOWER_004772 [Ataeniobius toweri]|uniref:Uncharacterized protein n=1 Tax=Ataeniobius toweri TaxID=208326 RepID=A0ABU7AMJ4_9TELE|nr:hypothetical protein [Ataeniobius toweri]
MRFLDLVCRRESKQGSLTDWALIVRKKTEGEDFISDQSYGSQPWILNLHLRTETQDLIYQLPLQAPTESSSLPALKQ